jgi:hypothetical protein
MQPAACACTDSSVHSPAELLPNDKLSARALALALHAPMNTSFQPADPQANALASASALAKEIASAPLARAKAEALAEAADWHSLAVGARLMPFV